MASFSIQKRILASGEPRFKATVTVKHKGDIVNRYSKTFKMKSLATAWAKHQVQELEHNVSKPNSVSIARLIDLYIDNNDLWDNTGRSKKNILRMLRDCDIAKVRTNELTTVRRQLTWPVRDN